MDPAILKKARIGAVVLSVLVYAILCGIHFDPKVRETSVKAFGAAPIGMPVTAVVLAGQTLLYLPMPFAFYHGMILLFRSQQEGGGTPRGLFSMLAFLVEAEKRFPELKPSVYACVGGLFYFGAIIATWIWYTNRLGI